MNPFRCFSTTRHSRGTQLLSNPFHSKQKVKYETEAKFPKPNFVSFDLFDTLYTPRTPVPEQYHVLARKHGVHMMVDDILTRFPVVFKQLQNEYPNYGKHSQGITTSDDWWRKLLITLFELPEYTIDEKSRLFCDHVLQHFTTAEAYKVYPDVLPALEGLKQKNIRLVITTNSDDRVYQILDSLQLRPYFDDIYISYDQGFAKPSKQLFDSIIVASQPLSTPTAEYLENCWHVGNHYDQDFVGCIKAGWNGIYLDRASNEHHILARNRVVVSDLSQMVHLFR